MLLFLFFFFFFFFWGGGGEGFLHFNIFSLQQKFKIMYGRVFFSTVNRFSIMFNYTIFTSNQVLKFAGKNCLLSTVKLNKTNL